MSKQAILKKEEEVKIVSEKMVKAQSNIIFEYRGLTVAEVSELRNLLREENIEMKVLKNNISRRSAVLAKYEELEELFSGPTAVAFSHDDAIAAARIINTFAKAHPNTIIKGGTIEGKVTPVDQIVQIANLPSREGLISMLLSVMQAPIRNFAVVTSQVAEQGDAGEVKVDETKTDAPAEEATPKEETKVDDAPVEKVEATEETKTDDAPAIDAAPTKEDEEK